tara:strand:+ start:5081 stop:5674 length:594 start_codon:yes stop_codon:yes gene_type:complete
MTFRIEKKIFIKKENFFSFKEYLDKKGVKSVYDSRKVESLYFDNLSKQMFKDSIEGLTPRKKIRVRNYPNSINKGFFLETKISSVEGRFKTNKKISNKIFDDFISNGIFDKKYGICKPTLTVVYDRQYSILDDIRITLDTDIHYKLYKSKILKKDNNIIVELKSFKDKNLDDLFKMFPFQEIRFSKYCNGIELFYKN